MAPFVGNETIFKILYEIKPPPVAANNGLLLLVCNGTNFNSIPWVTSHKKISLTKVYIKFIFKNLESNKPFSRL